MQAGLAHVGGIVALHRCWRTIESLQTIYELQAIVQVLGTDDVKAFSADFCVLRLQGGLGMHPL